MKVKAALLTVLTVAALGVVAAAAHSTPDGYTAMTRADLTIQHATLGCHTWALNGNASLAQHIVIRVGRSFTVRNADNCPHTLVQTSGPQAIMMSSHVDGAASDGNLHPRQAPVRVNLFEPGTYTFTTEEGVFEPDHALTGFDRMASSGQDNHLDLTVTVLPLAKADE